MQERERNRYIDVSKIAWVPLSGNSFGEEDESSTPRSAFINTFFITIATVLGTGILGLPVKLGNSGFTPFLFTYTIGFFVQCLVVLFMTELLQRGRVFNEAEYVHRDTSGEVLIPTAEFELMNPEDEIEDKETTQNEKFDNTGKDHIKRFGMKDEILLHSPSIEQNLNDSLPLKQDPDLHGLAKLFLSKTASIIFNISIMVQLTSLLISYSLAESQAVGQLFSFNYRIVIAPFVILFTLVIVFGSKFIKPMISLFTFGKGSLLLIIVIVTATVSGSIHHPIQNDWRYVGQPFLLGTVALGGFLNISPIVFSQLKLNRRDIIKFLISTIAGLFFVWLLNVLWCYFVLIIVPQHPNDGNINLIQAGANGQIATIPLVQVIETQISSYLWIGVIVDLFIIVSISVSFLTIGTGTKHVLDGFATHWQLRQKKLEITWLSWINKITESRIIFKQAIFYVGCFSFILLIALTNPKAFLSIMEIATSLAMSLTSGYFLEKMVATARSEYSLTIPLPLPDRIYSLRYILYIYFGFAIVYDIFTIILGWFVFVPYL